MPRIRVIDREGIEHQVELSSALSLMEALRELDFGVAAICGGECACATCHVYVDFQWQGLLPDRSAEEAELLDALAYATEESRLSCQIPLGPLLNGLLVTIAPEE